MKSIELKGSARTIAERSSDQSRAIKEIRSKGEVPCVLYGGGTNQHFTVVEGELNRLIYTPEVYIVDLVLGDKTVKAILQDIQYHPVSDRILHVDFYEINDKEPIIVQMPIKLTGLAKGVKAGGKLSSQMRRLKVKALYTDIPERLVIDVSHLAIGKTIKVSDVNFENLQLLNSKDAVICAVKLTRVARGLSAAAGGIDDEDDEDLEDADAEASEEGAEEAAE